MKSDFYRLMLAAAVAIGCGTAYAFDFQSDGIAYNIIEGGVEITKNDEAYTGVITVPETVTMDGKTYNVIKIGESALWGSTVTSISLPESLKTIGDNAFTFSKNLSDVVIPDNVTSVGKEAFSASPAIKTLTIGASVKTMGIEVFGNREIPPFGPVPDIVGTELDVIYCRATVPPVMEGTYSYQDPWQSSMLQNCVVYIPRGTSEVYRKAYYWGYFSKLIEYDYDYSGIEETVGEGDGIRVEGGRITGKGILDVYDLSGRQVARGLSEELPMFPSGIYIVRGEGTAAKIAVR
ncbi:MAG: leucine-rich repeat domain-containing protein [Duncaniella sp.]|nr:leucine-rich repeat domain-containing protein [Duncaniella sp.]